MTDERTLGPDIVIAGAARSGTSSLAAQLGTHPDVDPGKVKEPNYFSRGLDKGAQWYDALYQPRRRGLLRLDASVSYTSPLHPEALDRLAAESPSAFVVYVVRDPIQRAVSHFLFRRHYFHLESAPDFGTALRGGSYYVDGSDYSRWLTLLTATFPPQQLLVVPFEVVTAAVLEVTATIHAELKLDASTAAAEQAAHHRNPVVEYRTEGMRRAASLLRQSSLYPRLRSAVGGTRLRRIRGVVTRRAAVPTAEEAIASCAASELEQLRELQVRSGAAVLAHLDEQDQRLGLSWRDRSFARAPDDHH